LSLFIPLRRAHVAAFWCLAVAFAATVAANVAAAADAPAAWLWGVAAAGLLLCPRVVSPPWFETGVRAWNAGVRLTAAALRRYVLFVCYGVLLVPVGLAASSRMSFARAAPRRSAWLAVPVDAARPATKAAWAPPRRWHRALAAYAASAPDRWWSILLSPVVLLLFLLREEGRESLPPCGTYTLY
jgi:hypothetical protein